MVGLFRRSVVMCLFVFMLSMARVNSQSTPVMVTKSLDDSDVIRFEDASTVVTQSALVSMLTDVTYGITPDVCAPYMVCGFLLYKKNFPQITGDFIRYCKTCPEGFECKNKRQKLSQSYYIFTCQKIETTTNAMEEETESKATTHRPSTESLPNVGSPAHIHAPSSEL